MNPMHSIKSLTLAAGLLAMSPTLASAQIYNWTTIAGFAGGSADGTNTSALFYRPQGVAADTNGNLYVADTYNDTIRKLTLVGTNWVTTTIAGQPGVSGSADGTNGTAQFYYPFGIATDGTGSIYVTDVYTVRKLTMSGTNWVVTTLAGQAGSVGSADGTNGVARFYRPQGLAVDGAGSLYVADTWNQTIRKITPVGTNWVVTTVAGLARTSGSADGTNSAARFYFPQGVAVDNSGSVFVADQYNFAIRRITPVGSDWVVSTIAGLAGTTGSTDGTNGTARFGYPQGIAVDPSNNLFVTDSYFSNVRKVTPMETNWVVTTVAGLAAVDGSADGTNTAARFRYPCGVGVDGGGHVYVADTDNNMVRRLAPVGADWVVSTLAGVASFGAANGTNSTARFNRPYDVAVDSSQNVYVADYGNRAIRRATREGTNWVVTTLASGVSGVYAQGIAADANSNLFLADYNRSVVWKLAPTTTNWLLTTIAGKMDSGGYADGTNSDARFLGPRGVGVDSIGNVYVADQSANTVRKLTPLGTNWVVTTIAGYRGVSGTNDGVGTNALFNGLSGVVADAVGNLYVADQWNNTIRKITPVGTNWVVTTIAGAPGRYLAGGADGTNSDARFGAPGGLAVDGGGNLYTADIDGRIRKVTPVGTNWVVTTVGGRLGGGYADGINSAAMFAIPNGVAVDAKGNLFVADEFNNTIRLGVPLPVFQTPVMASGGFNFTWSAVPGQVFQLQYKTNLAQTDWTDLGGPLAGANGTAAASDIAPPDPQRLYRVLVLP